MSVKLPWQKGPKKAAPQAEGRPAANRAREPVAPTPPPRGDGQTRVQNLSNTSRLEGVSAPPAKTTRRRRKKGQLRPLTVVGVMLLNCVKALIVVLCIGLIIGSVAAVQVVQYVVEATEGDEIDLDNFDKAQTSYFMAPDPDKPGEYIEYQTLVGDENRIWVGIDEMPDNLVNAFIATEDREFGTHHGVNFRRTIAALINEVIPFQSNSFGASTITQQLVKNVTGEGMEQETDRTEGYQRKLREIFRAWGLHNNYSETTILEAYLNTIRLSGRLAGVEAGAQTYFGKTVSELNLHECAVIAGITRAPTYYSPYQNPENCLERRDDVIEFMRQCGFITNAEAQAVWDIRELRLCPRDQNPYLTSAVSQGTSAGIYSYFTDYAHDSVIADLMQEFDETYTQARWRLYNQGYRVYLTIDLDVQQALDDIMVTGYDEGGYFMDEEKFPGYYARLNITEEIKVNDKVVDYQEVMPQMASAVLSYDGALRAISGGIGEKTSSLSLNRAVGTITYDNDGNPVVQGTLRQPGSSMKPISAYAMGIDNGIITYSKTVMDAPIQPSNPYNPTIDPETGAPIKDWPNNYGGAHNNRHEKIPVVSAIAESTNTVAATVGSWVGREAMFEFLRDSLGITSLVEPRDVDLAPLVLGSPTYGLSVLEMASAYSIFGGVDTYGVRYTPHCYTRVEDSRGNIVVEPQITRMQAIQAQSGYIMNRLLQNVLKTTTFPAGSRPASPTAAGMAPEGEMPAAGKTGTTNKDNDRWFVGLTPYYVTAVWWGYDRDHQLDWRAGARNNVQTHVWRDLMTAVQQDYEVIDFPAQPDGIQELAFCTISGGLPQAGCPTMMGYYADFAIPEHCPGHGAPAEDPIV